MSDVYGAYNKQRPNTKGAFYGDLGRFEARTAKVNFGFGDPVFGLLGDATYGYKPVQNSVQVTLSGVLVTSNVITSIVKLNGVALTTVATTFATDSPTTIAAHIAAIDALTGVTCTAGTALVFTVDAADGSNVSITTTVTLGASQATASYVYDTSMIFLGVTPILHKVYHEVDETTGVTTELRGVYPADRQMDIMFADGGLWVEIPSGETLTYGYPVYVIANSDDADYLKFTKVATNNVATTAKFVTNPLNGLAAIRFS